MHKISAGFVPELTHFLGGRMGRKVCEGWREMGGWLIMSAISGVVVAKKACIHDFGNGL